MIKDMKEKCPRARQFWVRELAEYGSREELGTWLENLKSEVEKARPPVRCDSLEREWAEWSNLSVSSVKR